MKKLGLWIVLIYLSCIGILYVVLEIVIIEGVDSVRFIVVVLFKWQGEGMLLDNLIDVVMVDLC